jgi:hypothetical protein
LYLPGFASALSYSSHPHFKVHAAISEKRKYIQQREGVPTKRKYVWAVIEGMKSDMTI